MKTYCVLLASGTGSRFGGDIPKQFVKINERTIIEYTLDACMHTDAIDEIIVVVSEKYRSMMESLIQQNSYNKKVAVVLGGATRKDSCLNGVATICDLEAKVLIHNSVQPFILPRTFAACVDALDRYDAVTVGSPSVYTVLELNNERELSRIVDRSHSVNDLGPECFKLSFLKRMIAEGKDDNAFTNLTAMVLSHDLGAVYVVEGDPGNIKITYPEDLMYAKLKIEGDRK